jgi:multisubunit Na+/H+ antiporter MnhB subunit
MSQPGEKTRYAALHDFCLAIPYATAVVLIGMMALATPGANKFGWFAISTGVAQIGLSSLSLRTWKGGNNNAVWTMACLVLSSLLTYVSAQLYRMNAYLLISGSTSVLSGLISLFLAYNMLSGGNKPPTGHGKKSQ